MKDSDGKVWGEQSFSAIPPTWPRASRAPLSIHSIHPPPLRIGRIALASQTTAEFGQSNTHAPMTAMMLFDRQRDEPSAAAEWKGPIPPHPFDGAQGSHQSFAFGVFYIIVDPVTKALAKGHEAKSLPANVQRLKSRLSVVMSPLPSVGGGGGGRGGGSDRSRDIASHTHTHTSYGSLECKCRHVKRGRENEAGALGSSTLWLRVRYTKILHPPGLEKVGIRCQKARTASGEVYTCQASTLTVGQKCVLLAHHHPSWLGRACSQARHQKPPRPCWAALHTSPAR